MSQDFPDLEKRAIAASLKMERACRYQEARSLMLRWYGWRDKNPVWNYYVANSMKAGIEGGRPRVW